MPTQDILIYEMKYMGQLITIYLEMLMTKIF